MGVYDQEQPFDSLDMQTYEPVSVEDRFAGHSVQRPLSNKSVPQLVGAIACAAASCKGRGPLPGLRAEMGRVVSFLERARLWFPRHRLAVLGKLR